LNAPPIALPESFHPGPLPQTASFVSSAPKNIVVTAMKRWEDGDALILRCLETAGRATGGRIELPFWGRAIDASFGASEIKTLLVPKDPGAPVRETNLLEWPEEME
jgi:alpha-mannosidase